MNVFEVQEERSSVKREFLLTSEMLSAHLKEVGQRIIDDAEGFSIGPENIHGIKITARIRPGEEATSVCYEIQKYADSRIKKKEAKNE